MVAIVAFHIMAEKNKKNIFFSFTENFWASFCCVVLWLRWQIWIKQDLMVTGN